MTPGLVHASPVVAFTVAGVVTVAGVAHAVMRGAAGMTNPERETAEDLTADIRALGVDLFLSRCRLVAGPVPDPGHPGGMPLALWKPPASYGSVRVLEAFNGTPRTDGRYERIAHVVESRHRDPIKAAAASYGVPVETYAALLART
jgi:hypothetical protein